MAVRKPLVQIGGELSELPVGDSIATSSSYTELTLDFGSVPVKTKKFSVSVAGVLATNRVDITQSGYTVSGVADDEYEFSSIFYTGKCLVDGTLLITAVATSPVMGQWIAQVTLLA
jgi:hypothetical protein